MILRMCTLYEGQETAYTLSVGDGRMTIKWLGLAAAQRFATTVKPCGYRRHREKPGPIKITSTAAELLPRRVYTEELPSDATHDGTAPAAAHPQSTFLHPDKTICEEVNDGEEVFVVLSNKMCLNHIGRPMRDRWMFIAFSTSERHEQEREIAIASEYRAMDEAREQQREATRERAAQVAAQKGAQMRRIMISQLYCVDKVERAFERDWAKLCHPVTQPIDKVTEDLEEQSKIKDTLLAHYITLVEVFKHYASVSAAQSTGELDLMEYSAFMHDLRGFSAAKSRDLVEKVFGEAVSACRGEKGRTPTGLMGVVEFLFSAIRLACVRHHASPAIHASVGSGIGESGAASSKIKKASSVSEAVDLLMEGVMLPLAHRKVIGLQIKTSLDSNEVLAIYHDHDSKLSLVFDKYCKADDKRGSSTILRSLLSISEFGMILRDAGLLGGNNKEDDELTVKEARQAFAGAQNDLCGGDQFLNPTPPDIAAIEQMTYPEFLEGIARVAMLKWEDGSLTPKDKIGRAVDAVAALQPDGMKARTSTS